MEARTRSVVTELSGDENFPPVRETTEPAWAAAVADLKKAHEELFATLHTLTDADLPAPVPNRPYDRAFLLHGLPQHHAYHSGQMALLKKAAASQAGKETATVA